MHEEKDRIACALGSVKDEDRIKKVLDFSLSVSSILTQSSISLLFFLSRVMLEVKTQYL